MKLSKQTINSLKEIWKYEFEEDLDDIQAEKYASMIIDLAILFSDTTPSQEDVDMQ